MTRLTFRHWLVVVALATIAHLALALVWLQLRTTFPTAEQGEQGISFDLQQVVETPPEPLPEPAPEPEPEPEPEPVAPPDKPVPPAPVAAPMAPVTPTETSPPAPAASPVVGVERAGPPPDYLARLRSWLEKHKVYPRAARARREEGIAYLSLTFDRQGNVLESSIARSSGIDRLDQATLDIATRAAPLPALPADYPHETLRIVLPVAYQLR